MEMNFVVKTRSERLDGAFMLIASGICNAKWKRQCTRVYAKLRLKNSKFHLKNLKLQARRSHLRHRGAS